MTKKSLIEIVGLSKSYNTLSYALKNINLEIAQGDIFGIIGQSGAGKSTLMRCLVGLETPSSGEIRIGNHFLRERSDWQAIRTEIGMVFQNFQLFSSRTVAGNIAYPLEIQEASNPEARIDELLGLVGLQDKKNAYPSQLSGGEKQRVGIARALAHHPRILFCDEATSALDPQTTRSLLQLLLDLNQNLGLTIVLITHQLEVIKQICNRVAVINDGEIIEEGAVKDVLTRPQHSLTKQLLHLGIDQIPADLLMERCATKQLIRLSFVGHQAKQPVLSHLIKHYNVEANILFGGLDYLQQTLIGNLVVELVGKSEDIGQALQFLQDQHIYHEVIA
jgi:D-methionine transport system ATP-binding protein